MDSLKQGHVTPYPDLTGKTGANRHDRFLPGLTRHGKNGRLFPDLPGLDSRNRFDLLAHTLEISRLIHFFEAGDKPFGNWGDVLSLSPILLSAALLEEDARTAARMRILSNPSDPAVHDSDAFGDGKGHEAFAFFEGERNWQKKWEEMFQKAGKPCDLPGIHQGNEKNPKEMENGSFNRNTALILGLRRSRLREHAKGILETDLENPEGKLQPHEGMLLSFLHLFKKVQDRQNSLVSRYTDDFFKKMLQENPSRNRPDRVLISFGAEGLSGFTLAAGTKLQASALPLDFVTEEESPVCDFSLKAPLAITPLDPPGPFYQSMEWTDFNEERGKVLRDLFGEAEGAKIVQTCSSLLVLPGLALNGGERKIEIVLTLLSETGKPLPGDPDISGLLGEEGKWAFSLDLSTEEGWSSPKEQGFALLPLGTKRGDAKNVLLLPDEEEKEEEASANQAALVPEAGEAYGWELCLSFTLPPDFPGLSSPDPDVHGVLAPFPAIRMEPGDQESLIWQYLNALYLERLDLKTEVRGLRTFDILLHGDRLPNSPDMAVESFGSAPLADSAFSFTVPEFHGKKVEELRLNWNWQAPDSFAAYFAAYDFYPIGLLPSFRQSMGDWEDIGEKRLLHGKKDRFFDCPLPEDGKILDYRLRLVASGSLFGHADYPQLLAKASLNESTLPRRIGSFITQGLRLKDLNPPFTPVWSDISLDYTAQTAYFPEENKGLILYLHSLPGIFPAEPEKPRLFHHQDAYTLALCPEFPEEGKNPFPLSLYFRLQNTEEKVLTLPMQTDSAILLKDDTKGLTRSGIMHLLPESKRFFLSWQKKPGFTLQGIHENAVWAVFKPKAENEDDVKRPWPLPAGSPFQIAEDALLSPEVKAGLSLHAPYPSSGGREEKKGADFYQDAAENLSHREQAILPKDYERLSLREFPQICAVRCLPHCNENLDAEKPGAVCLIVLAPQEGARIHDLSSESFLLNPALPAYADEALLQEVHAFIESQTSPHMRLYVRNPLFEGLRAHLKLRLDPWKNEEEAQVETKRLLSRWMAPWAFFPENTLFGTPLYTEHLLQELLACTWCMEIAECCLDFRGSSHDLLDPAARGLVVPPQNRAALFYPESLDLTLEPAGEKQ